MLHSSDLRAALSWTIADIHAKGWATGTGGNFSVVMTRSPLTLLMAPSGVDKGMVQPADLIVVDAAGAVSQGEGKASAETFLHLAIVQSTGAGAVLHTHSVFNTLLSEYYLPKGEIAIAGYEMLKGLAGVTTHESIVSLPILPNSQDMSQLSQAVCALLDQDSRSHSLISPAPLYGVLIAGHGLYTWGEDLFQARRHLEILEFLFELTYRKLSLPPLF